MCSAFLLAVEIVAQSLNTLHVESPQERTLWLQLRWKHDAPEAEQQGEAKSVYIYNMQYISVYIFINYGQNNKTSMNDTEMTVSCRIGTGLNSIFGEPAKAEGFMPFGAQSPSRLGGDFITCTTTTTLSLTERGKAWSGDILWLSDWIGITVPKTRDFPLQIEWGVPLKSVPNQSVETVILHLHGMFALCWMDFKDLRPRPPRELPLHLFFPQDPKTGDVKLRRQLSVSQSGQLWSSDVNFNQWKSRMSTSPDQWQNSTSNKWKSYPISGLRVNGTPWVSRRLRPYTRPRWFPLAAARIGPGKPWENLGKPWENHGKTMGKPWENHGKTMGKPWENHGKTPIDCATLKHRGMRKCHKFEGDDEKPWHECQSKNPKVGKLPLKRRLRLQVACERTSQMGFYIF